MTTTPKWAVGMRKIGPGIYVNEKTRAIHISERELCEHFQVPYNAENIRIIEEAAMKVAREQFPDIKTEVREP
jgi:hypothetical protein